MERRVKVGNDAKAGQVDLFRLTQQQAAGLIGVTARTLRDWSDAPRNDDETYHGPNLVRWRLEKLSKPSGLDLDNERARHAKQQADRLELENALRRGEVADLNVVSQVLGAAFGTFRARLLATPSKLAPLVNPGNPNLARDLIDRELSGVLDELAGLDVRGIRLELPADAAGPAADPEVPAEADGEPVGGRVPKAQRGKQRRAGKVANR